MAGAIWPLTLPQSPLVSGYTETMPSNLLRSETETGPVKVRRRGGAKPIVAQATYVLSSEQTDLLDTFVYGSIGGGAMCFDWPRPKFKKSEVSYVRARLVPTADGMYAKYAVDGSNDFWKVTLTIEMFPDVPTIN